MNFDALHFLLYNISFDEWFSRKNKYLGENSFFFVNKFWAKEGAATWQQWLLFWFHKWLHKLHQLVSLIPLTGKSCTTITYLKMPRGPKRLTKMILSLGAISSNPNIGVNSPKLESDPTIDP